MTRSLGAVIALSALLLVGCTGPAPDPTPTGPNPDAVDPAPPVSEDFTAVIGSVVAAPHVAPSTDGRVHLAYELQLLNAISQAATIERLEVLGDGASLLVLEDDEIAGWTRPFGADFGRVLAGGQGALVWLDVAVDSMEAVPDTLTHQITFTIPEDVPPVILSPFTETIAATPVVTTEPIIIGPPLKGDGWLDGNSCCAVTPHRGAMNAINGAIHGPERFAIDYVRLAEDGKFLHGAVDDLEAYDSYGEEIIAVGDGPIVAMVWDLEQHTPGADPTGLKLEEYGGNHIVQDLGNGHYAFYAHLQPGNPFGLQVGQELKRGDVIAHLGNSGNSDSPHLHFHIMDSPLPLASNGLPFLIDSFVLAGRIPSEAELLDRIGAGGPWTLDTTGAGERTNESPLFLDVMNYPK